ncbi:cytochrome P450 [Xylaria cf. heliscus]|nr:cytochrome P450 [Xylaria cf. heliscus]
MLSHVYFVRIRILAWLYLFRGASIIQHYFNKSNGEPFEIYAPDVRMAFVSSPKHIKELDSAPDTVLSLNGAAKHMLQPVYTMNGFNWFDRRGVEGVGFVRTLRTLLTNNIPCLLPNLGTLTQVRWKEVVASNKAVDGSTQISLYPAIMTLVVLLNARSLFGEDLIKNERFMCSALGYVEETLLSAEVVKLLPSFLVPIVGGGFRRCFNSHKMFFDSLIPATEQRLQEKDFKRQGHQMPERADCIQWIIETAPKQKPWSAERVIYELMAIWFGSTIIYVIHDLCLYPEYIEPIRRELEASYEQFERTGQGLPLLDSFIKESTRLTPVESMSVRRRALQPFTLSDGTKVSVGEWACAPLAAINTHAQYYPSPETFSGFRFVDPAILSDTQEYPTPPAMQTKPSKLTDVDHSFLMWGTGRMACPGRYYASAFMKVVIAQLLMNYDFELVKPRNTRWISWRVAKIPKPWTKVAFTTRN